MQIDTRKTVERLTIAGLLALCAASAVVLGQGSGGGAGGGAGGLGTGSTSAAGRGNGAPQSPSAPVQATPVQPQN